MTAVLRGLSDMEKLKRVKAEKRVKFIQADSFNFER